MFPRPGEPWLGAGKWRGVVLLCPGKGVFGFGPCSTTSSGSSHPLLPPVLVGCWQPLAVPHSAVVCLILSSSGDGSWVTGGSPLSIVPCWWVLELRVLPLSEPPTPQNCTWGSRVPFYPLLHMGRGGFGSFGGVCKHQDLPWVALCLSFPIAWGRWGAADLPCSHGNIHWPWPSVPEKRGIPVGVGGGRVMPALPCWQMDGVLHEAGVSHVLGIHRCGAGSSGADPGARGWGWRQVHWEKPAQRRVGGNRFPQELRTNLAPSGGGKQPLAPLLPAPSDGNAAEVPNPSLQSALCSQGSRRRSRHRDLGAMRDVLGGTLWDSPAWEQVLVGGWDGAGGLLFAAEPKYSPHKSPCACLWV